MYMEAQELQEHLETIAHYPKLTKKMALFCQYFTDLTDLETYGNGNRSALKCGYSLTSARHTASKLLKSVAIQREIKRIEDNIVSQVNFSKPDYVRILVIKANTTKAEAVQARYWELIGRCKGYIEPDTGITANLSLFQALDGKISKRLQVVESKGLSEVKAIAVNPSSLTTNEADKDHALQSTPLKAVNTALNGGDAPQEQAAT